MAKKQIEPDYPPVICTVDVVLLTLKSQALHVVLLKRKNEPFADSPALPGGYIHTQEDKTAWEAASRVLRDKTGITSPYLEQLATYSGADRDPRGGSVSIVYYALIPLELRPANREGWLVAPLNRMLRMPFDHKNIGDLAVDRVL